MIFIRPNLCKHKGSSSSFDNIKEERRLQLSKNELFGKRDLANKQPIGSALDLDPMGPLGHE
jgi:hypothetical protein